MATFSSKALPQIDRVCVSYWRAYDLEFKFLQLKLGSRKVMDFGGLIQVIIIVVDFRILSRSQIVGNPLKLLFLLFMFLFLIQKSLLCGWICWSFMTLAFILY